MKSPWEVEKVSDKLKSIRYTQLITDPFPDHTSFEGAKKSLFELSKILRMTGCVDISLSEPEPVSIWAAYKMGYAKAYKEIEEAIGNRELK